MPSPFEWFLIHVCFQASLCSAIAPAYGNDPFRMGVTGLFFGFITGLPAYAWALR